MSDTTARERPKRPAGGARARPKRPGTRKPARAPARPRPLRKKTRRTGPSVVTRLYRRTRRAVSTPRGALLGISLIVIAIGVIGFLLVLGAGTGTPRLAFDDADGGAEAIRENVLASTRDGDVAESLAPDAAAPAADALADAPIYFLSAFAEQAEDEATVIEKFAVTERVAFVNTADVEIDEARFDLAVALAGGDIEDLEAGADARAASVSGSVLTADLASPLAPGEQAVVELSLRVVPQRLQESADIGDVLSGTGDIGTASQLTRRNLVYMIDWYPRLARLGHEGWLDGPADVAAFDTTGTPSIAHLDVEFPDGWDVTAGGTKIEEVATADDRARERFVLAGSRALPLVAMRNSARAEATQGSFRATGVALDTFEITLQDAVEQALFAKAALSEAFESTLWRDTVVVALALRGTDPMIVSDNVILVDQTLISGAPTQTGPGSQAADYRQAVFEGVAGEWWGGRTDIDGWRLPAYVRGLRTWSAALVWGAFDGAAGERAAAAQTLAAPYREGRDAGTPDVPASLAYPRYPDENARTIAMAKIGLMQPGVAVALEGGAMSEVRAVEAIATPALAALGSELFRTVDADAIVDAYVDASGRSRADVAAVVEPWLAGTEGDAEIGLSDGAGSIPAYTDAATASRDVGSSGTASVSDVEIRGFGPGWAE